MELFGISGATVEPTDAFLFFYKLSLGKSYPGFIFGASVRFFIALAAFAANLVERGRVMPEIHEIAKNKLAGMWNPILTSSEAVLLSDLAIGV